MYVNDMPEGLITYTNMSAGGAKIIKQMVMLTAAK